MTTATIAVEKTRVEKAIDAGYSPYIIPKPPGWEFGTVRQDPRPYPWLPERIDFLLVIGAFATFLIVWGSFPTFWGFLAGVTNGAIIGLCEWVNKHLQERNRVALRKAGIWTTTRFFKGPLPPDALEALTNAEGFFDKIEILAPEKAFRKVMVGDPYLIGWIGRQRFYIHAFDMG